MIPFFSTLNVFSSVTTASVSTAFFTAVKKKDTAVIKGQY